jgi:hypothetical protein
LIQDRVRTAEGPAQADALAGAWNIIMSFRAGNCFECGEQIKGSSFDVVHAETEQRRHGCLPRLTAPPAYGGSSVGTDHPPATSWWATRLFRRLIGARRARAESRPSPWQLVIDGVRINPDRVLRVVVRATGEIRAEGRSVTPEQLAARMAVLKQAGGVVWYYRENPERQPHRNAMQVIELVTRLRLPIRLSTEPDFSDSAAARGVAHPSGAG